MNGVPPERRAPYVIRLRGPWHFRPLKRLGTPGLPESSCPLPAAGTCRVPTTWAGVFGNDFLGRARFERRFGCPSELAAGDRVQLVLQGFDGTDGVAVNDVELNTPAGCGELIQVDITELLSPRNVVAVEVVALSEPACCRIGEARLEVLEHDS
jgi:beta-galactosidase/beta-glucuronidase